MVSFTTLSRWCHQLYQCPILAECCCSILATKAHGSVLNRSPGSMGMSLETLSADCNDVNRVGKDAKIREGFDGKANRGNPLGWMSRLVGL